MRLNKVSELIHNSTNHQNLDSAGVSVQFEEIIDLVKLLSAFLSFKTLLLAIQIVKNSYVRLHDEDFFLFVS